MSTQTKPQKSSETVADEKKACLKDVCPTTTSLSDPVEDQKVQSHQNFTEATSILLDTKNTSCKPQIHPIRHFIDQLFANKEETKRQKWAKFFIDQQYDDIDQLKKLSEEEWKTVSASIPMKIISEIRDKLKEGQKIKQEVSSKVETLQQKKEETLQTPVQKHEEVKHIIQEEQKQLKKAQKVPVDDGKLTQQDKIQLNEYLEGGVSQKFILKLFKVVEGSPKWNSILLEIQSRRQKPQKVPVDDGKLTQQDKIQLNEYLEGGVSQKYILKLFKVVEGSPKWNSILFEIKSRGKKPQKNPVDDGKLTSQDKMQLSKYLNEGLSQKKILNFFNVAAGSPKGNAILLEIKSLMKPPKPEPQGCQRVGVKMKQKALPLFHYRGKKLQFVKYYTLLVVGETGSGKTTLLDAFVNKLTGMEFTDNWRWKLVNQDHLKNVPQGQSQTSEITTYYINDANNRFNIRIIDTPGFGDTKGLAVDDLTVQKFDSLFNTISEIDYVLLTVKATETRLKPGSIYVYNRVQQIFGVDAKDRFILMCTFADGSIPKCIETFQKAQLHFDKYFPFNNSSIYVPSGNSNSNTQFFWKMAISSIQEFEDYIISADKSPLSLKLSREVLEARKYLQQSIKTSQTSIIDASKQLDVTKQNLTNWKRNKKQIEQNGQYTQMETRTTFPYTNLGKTVQMCNNCKITCCQVCQWPPNSVESACTYFRNGAGCPICPGKCPKSAHVRTTDFIRKVVETVPVVINCKKQAHDQGVTLQQKFKNDLKKNQDKIRVLANAIWQHGTEIKSNLKKLEQIALQPKMWTDEDFYQQMIAQEEDQRKDGWVSRVKYLKDTLARMKNCKELVNAASIQDIFPELKTLKKDAESQSSSSCEIY